ncbi:hypothetical protein Pmar_PMAR006117, partial [Perkinsus marinus ATCC 50983]
STPIPSHTTPHEYLVVNFRDDQSLICDVSAISAKCFSFAGAHLESSCQNFSSIFRELHRFIPHDFGHR